ncbi:hypothetical protein [Pseudomonas juntendi]|jgi:hypothetical protein|uniref:hypothetical protein n=1 Tax=Pseudomonas juntendi TaxID=2666183 RepID=UPI001379F00B|nr:hypothetical protein [Pseudomonas juntendi]
MKDNDAESVVVIDEAYMEQFSDDQLAYKAWTGVDLVEEVLLNDEFCASCMHDAKIEAVHACLALRVLVRRLCGSDPEALRKAVLQRYLEQNTLDEEVEQMPAWRTLQ